MTDESRRRGIVELPITEIMTNAVADLLPEGTTVFGIDVGMTDRDELALVVAHPDLSEVPEGAYPPLVEVRSGLRFVETGWRKITDGPPFTHTIGTEHGTYSPWTTLEFDSETDSDDRPVCTCGEISAPGVVHRGDGLPCYRLDTGPIPTIPRYAEQRDRSEVCVCKHSPEGHALSGCTVNGCGCRARPTAPPAFPGFTGARVSFEDTPYNSIRDEFPRTGR